MALQVVMKPQQPHPSQKQHRLHHRPQQQQQHQSPAPARPTTNARQLHYLQQQQQQHRVMTAAPTTTTSSAALALHRSLLAASLRAVPEAAAAMRRLRASRPPASRTVFVLDWDDTCCATSFLERCGVMADLDTCIEDAAPQLARYLRLLEQRVLALLQTAARLGTVLIVTNAGDGWVELSSSRFLPAVRAFLLAHQRDIKIVSARARYVHAFRTQPLQWKTLTFADELRPLLHQHQLEQQQQKIARQHQQQPEEEQELQQQQMQQSERMHVVVLGDSIGDRYAAHEVDKRLAAEGLPLVLKVVKFLERPTIDQLCKQLAVVLDHIYAMTVHATPFDVSMYKDVGAANTNTTAATATTPPSSPAPAAQTHAQQEQQQQRYRQQYQQQLHAQQQHHHHAHVHHHPHHLTHHDMGKQGEKQVPGTPGSDGGLVGGVAPLATCAAAV